MSDNLKEAIKILDEKGYTCVLSGGEVLYTSTERGVAPLIELIKDHGTLEGFCAADKVVGKAAALLYIKMKVSRVHAKTASKSAVHIFKKYGVPFTYESRCEYIINRKGDGPCPMESAVSGTDSPEEAFYLICEKQSLLRKSE